MSEQFLRLQQVLGTVREPIIRKMYENLTSKIRKRKNIYSKCDKNILYIYDIN